MRFLEIIAGGVDRRDFRPPSVFKYGDKTVTKMGTVRKIALTKVPRPKKPTVARLSVEKLIHMVRGRKVMLDRDLGVLYGVKTIALRQQVKRNKTRFPADFMFRLTVAEVECLVSQNVIPDRRSLGGFLPYVFTQEGIAMLSSVLSSRRAIQMNIDIMRAFVRLRQMIEDHKDVATRLTKLERGQERTASVIEILVFDIDRLAGEVTHMKALPPVTRRRIGFRPDKV